jgi:hypothetical protein
MGGFGFGVGRHRRKAAPAGAVGTSITGFALNGSSNAILKAAVARVKANTGRGRIVFKGDSTTVGQGGGSGAPYNLAGARANRIPAVLSSLLSTAGIATLDNSMVGDNGMTQAGFGLGAYDTRASPGAWSYENGQGFAGGNFLTNRAGAFSFAPATNVDTFEVDIYNSNVFNLSLSIDGVAPSSVIVAKTSGSPAAIVTGSSISIPGAGSGFSRIVVTAANTGAHSLAMTSSTGFADGAIRSISAYASATRALDILVHAALGATAVNQAAIGNGWSNNDALAFDAPDLTIINCGLNEMGSGGSSSAYSAALQTMIATARLSGDVLLMFPHPSGSPYNNNVATFRNIASGLAVSNSIAFISLYDYFGGTFTPALQARMADGIVHGTAEFYAEVGDVLKQCILAMT